MQTKEWGFGKKPYGGGLIEGAHKACWCWEAGETVDDKSGWKPRQELAFAWTLGLGSRHALA